MKYSSISCVLLLILIGQCFLVKSAHAQYDDKELTDTIDQILSQPEYRRLLKEKKEDVVEETKRTPSKERVNRRPSSNSRPPGTPLFDPSGILFIFAIAVLAVILVAIGIAIAKASPEMNPNLSAPVAAGGVVAPVTPPGDIPTNEYEQRALEFARNQDFRSALRELILGSMSWIERSGRIRFRRGLTNRDYIRAIWRLQDRRASMSIIVKAFELVYYGHRDADSSMFKRCLEEFRTSFAKEEDVHATLAK